MDKISIITAVYNTSEDLINRLLNAILNQSYTNYEWVITDDGSCEKTKLFLDNLCEKYSFIKCIHQENKGTGTAKYTAFTHTTGDYIAYIDSDDCMHKDYFKILLELIKENNTKMSVVSFELVDEKFTPSDIKINKEITEILNFNHYTQRLSGEYQILYATLWGKLFAKEIFENIKFPIGYMIDDEPLIYQLVFNAGSVAVNYMDLFYYTKMETSVMNTKEFKEYRLELIDIYKERIEFIKEKTDDLELLFIVQRFYLENLIELKRNCVIGNVSKSVYQKRIKTAFKSTLKQTMKNKNAGKKFLLKMIGEYIIL